MTVNYAIQINQGEDYYECFQWLTGPTKEPVKLNGYTGKAQIRTTPQSEGILATLQVIILDATLGKYALSLTSAQSSAIPSGGKTATDLSQFVYDVEFSSPDGTVYRVQGGIFYMSPETTRPVIAPIPHISRFYLDSYKSPNITQWYPVDSVLIYDDNTGDEGYAFVTIKAGYSIHSPYLPRGIFEKLIPGGVTVGG